MNLREGLVVSCLSRVKVEEPVIKNGTVWLLTDNKAFILDSEGYVHEVPRNEVYKEQV